MPYLFHNLFFSCNNIFSLQYLHFCNMCKIIINVVLCWQTYNLCDQIQNILKNFIKFADKIQIFSFFYNFLEIPDDRCERSLVRNRHWKVICSLDCKYKVQQAQDLSPLHCYSKVDIGCLAPTGVLLFCHFNKAPNCQWLIWNNTSQLMYMQNIVLII
jgi:hypothetical protein